MPFILSLGPFELVQTYLNSYTLMVSFPKVKEMSTEKVRHRGCRTYLRAEQRALDEWVKFSMIGGQMDAAERAWTTGTESGILLSPVNLVEPA
jgi:hypothetical protein